MLTSPTRPVNTSNLDDIFLSEKASFSMTGSGTFEVPDETRTADIWYNALWYSRNSNGVLFALHEACIETSCRAIDDIRNRQGSATKEPTLSILYHFLNSRFFERHANLDLDPALYPYSAENTENDIFNLCHHSKIYGPRSVLAMTRLEWWGGEHDVREFYVY
jgi:hypothetical protein